MDDTSFPQGIAAMDVMSGRGSSIPTKSGRVADALYAFAVNPTNQTCAQMSHEKKKQKRPYFPLNPGWSIGILIVVYDNPHIIKLG